MWNSKPPLDPASIRPAASRLAGGLLLALWFAGCGTSTKSSTGTTTPVTVPAGPQLYFAPNVAEAVGGLSTFTIDDTMGQFSQTTYLLEVPQEGPQVLNAGCFLGGNGACIASPSTTAGLRSLGIQANYVPDTGTSPPQFDVTNYDPPLTGSFGIELASRTGGLVQLVGQPVQPLVAATQCPAFSKPQTYEFLTIPAALAPPGTVPPVNGAWDPTTETAYGTVDLSSSGSVVTFQNIHQFTLPSVGGTGTPTAPADASVTGACGSTYYGNTISVPGQTIVTGPGNGQTTTPQAVLGVGSSGGMLVEDNGTKTPYAPTDTPYNNVLGAGTGAVGLPQPASAVDTGKAVGAQYLGFIYAAGTYPGNSSSPTGWSSHVASFGFSSVPASCASVAPPTATLIYGGDFPNDAPFSSPGGVGNCDFAIDLGSQSTSTNGLFLAVTVWVGAAYAGNTMGMTYSFPAVAISGQIGAKYALFVLGVDSNQPWAIDLLQSN